jgi:hypothetical protein
MANGELPIPIEVPWKLASTTQALTNEGAEPATVSLFYYEPQLESFALDYPDERLVYFKFTVSISPLRFLEELFPSPDLTGLDNFVPVHHVVLDLKVTPQPHKIGGIRPYFHAAAPLHRSMVQTGVIGYELYEGESDGVSIGKSGSQLHETLSSKTKTKTSQSGAGAVGMIPAPVPMPVSASTSSSASTTTVDSERNVDQFLETTNRDASLERRELLSHTTHVDNVLSLLDAKHVGSPYLRFSLWPRPLLPLAAGPPDAALWYSEILHTRSSGVEGVQEFFALVVAPRDSSFCIHATLHRAGLLDIPPEAPDYLALRDKLPTAEDMSDIDEYLHRTYPTGTPVDELDVDLDLGKDLLRPAVVFWYVEPQVVRLLGRAIGKENQTLGAAQGELFFRLYKTNIELRLEALRARYEEELARSPVERGIVLLRTIELHTCFAPLESGALGVLSVPPLVINVGAFLPQWDQPLSNERLVQGGLGQARFRSAHAGVRWNAFVNNLAARLTNGRADLGPPIAPDHPRIVDLVIARWRRLAAGDPRNLSLEQVASRIGLKTPDVRLLTSVGATDLHGIGRALDAAPRIERLNGRIGQISAALAAESSRPSAAAKRRPKLKPLSYPISAADAARIRRAIGTALKG